MAAAAGTPAAKLLDFSQPLDVPLLDATVTAFYGAASTEEVSLAAGFCYISAFTASTAVVSDEGTPSTMQQYFIGICTKASVHRAVLTC
jgi:hypothetical protein